MPLPPAPSELGAKLATTRTKASAREDTPRSETLEELRERIRARTPRPVEPAAAAPAEKATAPAPTKESQPAKPAEKSAKKKQKKAPVAAAKKETQRKETPKTAAPVAKSEKTAPADVSARAAAPSDEKPVPTVPAESVYVPPPAEKKPSEAFPAADRLFAAGTSRHAACARRVWRVYLTTRGQKRQTASKSKGRLPCRGRRQKRKRVYCGGRMSSLARAKGMPCCSSVSLARTRKSYVTSSSSVRAHHAQIV